MTFIDEWISAPIPEFANSEEGDRCKDAVQILSLCGQTYSLPFQTHQINAFQFANRDQTCLVRGIPQGKPIVVWNQTTEFIYVKFINELGIRIFLHLLTSQLSRDLWVWLFILFVTNQSFLISNNWK